MLQKKIAAVTIAALSAISLHANDPFFSDPFGDDIFKEMMQMQQQMDRMFERMHQRIQQRSKALISPIGTYKIDNYGTFADKGDHYEFKTDIPKSKDNNVNISVKDGMLTVDAKVIKKEETKKDGMVSYQSYMSMYQRSISLPADADESSMQSDYRDGYLVITFKKKGSSSKKDANNTNKK